MKRTAVWTIGLVAIATFINYVDRGLLGTAGPLLKHDLLLTNFGFGVVTSAFFWTYTPGQLLSAWVTERLGPHRTLALGFALWSLATALTGVAQTLWMLIALRLLLGLGESAAAPSGARLVVDAVPAARFGLTSGVIGAGIAMGPSFGTLTGGLLMVHYGWRVMFLVFGLVALLWLLPWQVLSRNDRNGQASAAQPVPPPYPILLRQRRLWGAVMGHLMANYALYFLLAWLPLYLVKDRGLSLTEMAGLGGAVYGIYGVSAIATGWIADFAIARGIPLNRVRKTVIGLGHCGLALCLLGTVMSGRVGGIAFLLVSGLFCGLVASSLAAITQTMAGPRAAARWTGVQNMLANLAGIGSPIVTGALVDSTGSFTVAFAVAGLAALIGAIGWLFVIDRVEEVRW